MVQRKSAKSSSRDDRLTAYRSKRSPGRTPEPFGGEGEGIAGGVFVVQKHAARRTHFDLRLEVDGILKSWAVPHGPSLDPRDKRLAIETEDHPGEYADFEGIIPAGNYGAGAMIVWDRGSWIALEDFDEGFRRGKLLFELRGYKLRGTWTLFRTKKPAIHRGKEKNEDRQWLLVKKPDAAATDDPDALSPESVLSGLTVEELRDAGERRRELRQAAEDAGAAERELKLEDVDLMLAELARRPFSRRNWFFELKYDGYRLLASRHGQRTRLRYRNGHDASQAFPEITRALEALPIHSAILDGEVVILDQAARPSFQRLQSRAMLSRPRDARRAAARDPATYYVFDLLILEGLDLRPLPLRQRKDLLRRLIPPRGPVRLCDDVEEQGEALFREIQKMGLEGMVAKDADSPYVGGRSSSWRKIRIERTADLVVVGWREGKGFDRRLSSLHLGLWQPPRTGESTDLTPAQAPAAGGAGDKDLIYAGRVGSGFSDAQLEELTRELELRKRSTAPCRGKLPTTEGNHWVEPELVVEVRFSSWTNDGLLRHPVFLRLRDDKEAEECRSTELRERPELLRPIGGRVSSIESPGARKEPRLSNLDKIFWPEEGYTKGDLIEFYREIAPFMLPFLRDRPVVLTRYPDGIHGKSFFQKNAPDFIPEWMRTVTIWSESSEREIDYFVCEDTDSLVYLANLGTIPVHMWSSRLGSLDRPDWCILDLDPKGADFKLVVEVARGIRALCDELGMASFVKTSGSTGVHVLVPLGARYSYEQSRLLGQLIAKVVTERAPEIATITRSLERREGRVYIDFVQNGHGRLLVAPYSVRPLPGAPVSTPLRWRELGTRLDPKRYTIQSVRRRVRGLKSEPLAPVLEGDTDLGKVLQRLSELLG